MQEKTEEISGKIWENNNNEILGKFWKKFLGNLDWIILKIIFMKFKFVEDLFLKNSEYIDYFSIKFELISSIKVN